MTSAMRRSFKEKAKERLGIAFRLGSTNLSSELSADDEDDRSPGSQDPFLPSSVSSVDSPILRERLKHRSDSVKMSSSEKRRSRVMSQPKGTITYTVDGSDTLASIAAQFDTTTSDLKRLNRLMSMMIFPGQVLYVPDKDYIASSESSPAISPTENKDFMLGLSPPTSSSMAEQQKHDIPVVGMRKSKPAPGHAKRQEVTSSSAPTTPATPTATTSAGATRRPSSMDEVDRTLDEDCVERFLKINVKHITDGQGVVSGVLLVTPNAVMFDPNVSDPLVVDQGPDMYGMIAPMETIVSAAMFHDIAAMKVKTKPANGVDDRSDEEKIRPEVYHASSCPVAAKNSDSSAAKDDNAVSDAGGESAAAAADDDGDDIRRPRRDTNCSCGAEEKETSARVSEDNGEERRDVNDNGGGGGHTGETKNDEYKNGENVDDTHNKDTTDGGDDEVRDESKQRPSSELHEDEEDDIFTLETGNEPKPGEQQHDETSEKSGDGSEKSGAGEKGLIRRTLGSVGSLASTLGSSFPGSPNMSSIVNFSSGLFGLGEEEAAAGGKVGEAAAGEDGGGGGTVAEGGKMDFAVHNAVRLVDRPDLFKSLDELVPKPASHYEDPPLYLCLKIGSPVKLRTRTCPIESYVKKHKRAEYWFSIPQNRVDQLYSFFVQWSPNIYGVEEDIDPESQGFVVLLEEDENFDFMDNHFDTSKHISKNWEIVNKEEARRRISEADEDNMPLPELLDTSTLLTDDHVLKLSKQLLPRAEGYPWTLIYSSDKHGFSLKTMYRTMNKIDSPVLLVVKDTSSQIFGAMLSKPLKISDHFYGTGESFLWTFYPEFKKFVWTGGNNFFVKGNTESLAIGAGEGSFGLWLDGDLYHGRTQTCQTYDNDLLGGSEDFMIRGIEVWGFI